MESNHELKEIIVKNGTRFYCYDDIIEIEDFDLDNISVDEKPYKNVLVYNISYIEVWFILSLYVLVLIKWMDLLEFMMVLDIQYYLGVKM